MLRVFSGVFLLLLTLVVAIPPVISGEHAKPVDLPLTDLHGKRVRLRDYRGKIVVLNFWATWCGPCNQEMPLLVSVEKEYSARGVIFLGASLDDSKTEEHIPDFLRKYHVQFPILLGATADNLEKLRLGQGVPATAFIDREGMVAARVSGEIREQEIRQRLDWLLGDRSVPPPPRFVDHVGH